MQVRPGGARLRGELTVEDFPHQPAGVWGTGYAAFLKKFGMRHVVATVLLPRHDVIVRHIHMPGVSGKDLAGAIQFQLDGLHPYNDDDVTTSWTRLPGSASVLVAIARRDAIERYSTLFAEAGIKIGSFTCSAAVLHSGLRMFGRAPAAEFLAYEPTSSGFELYGESPAKPLFSAHLDGDLERVSQLAAAELRIENAIEPKALAELAGAPALPFAAAIASACPRLSTPLNLLPKEQRQTSSPLVWVPAAALGVVVLLLAGGLAAFPRFEDSRYVKSLAGEIAKVQPGATRAAAMDREVDTLRKRTALLDDFRRRPRADMDVLAEMTRLLPPPTWLNLLEINARQVTVAGETDQAAPLLKVIDASPLFVGSEFAMPPIRLSASAPGSSPFEGFRIRTNREALR